MKFEIDMDHNEIVISGPRGRHQVALYSREGFEIISELWLKVGWNEKYSYTFSWFGRPIIQLPEDLIRIQEVIWALRPDVIIETGVAHGGSLIFYASLISATGKDGRVIGIDVEIRPHNRKSIESHLLAPMITLIEGNSTDPSVVAAAAKSVRPDNTMLIILDSNHTYAHVAKELEAYSELVTPGSYIVVADGIMSELADTPRGKPHWRTDNPARAAADFVATHNNFLIEQPSWPFNESDLKRTPTYWPCAWLKRLS